MKDFLIQYDIGIANLESQLKRKLTESESTMLLMNLIRLKLGLKIMPGSLGNRSRAKDLREFKGIILKQTTNN